MVVPVSSPEFVPVNNKSVLTVASVFISGAPAPAVLRYTSEAVAMFACLASDTAPLREAIIDGETGALVDFFDPAALSSKVNELLENPVCRLELGENARDFAVRNYDLRSVCLPRMIDLIERAAQAT